METLSIEESKLLIGKLYDIFNVDKRSIDGFLSFKPVFGIVWRELPLLWFPQKRENLFLRQVFDKYIVLGYEDENILRKSICPVVSRYLSRKKVIENYVLADWYPREKNIFRRVVKTNPAQIESVNDKFYAAGYFFDKSLDWLFCVTNERFCFLAGTDEFISDFKKFFPDYAQYDLDYDPFGKEPDSDNIF